MPTGTRVRNLLQLNEEIPAGYHAIDNFENLVKF
jgi:hypothetical protein